MYGVRNCITIPKNRYFFIGKYLFLPTYPFLFLQLIVVCQVIILKVSEAIYYFRQQKYAIDLLLLSSTETYSECSFFLNSVLV